MQYKVKIRLPREVLDDSQIPLVDYDGDSEMALIVNHLREATGCGEPRYRSNAQSLTAVWQGVGLAPPLGVINMTTQIIAVSEYASVKIDPYKKPIRRPSRKVRKRREREYINRLVDGETPESMGGIIDYANRPTSEPYRPR